MSCFLNEFVNESNYKNSLRGLIAPRMSAKDVSGRKFNVCTFNLLLKVYVRQRLMQRIPRPFV